MSTPHQQRKEEPDSNPAPNAAADKDKPAATPDAGKPGLKYVFKIAPADPKRNSIDFEDVADK
jgi:hypothetical protein